MYGHHASTDRGYLSAMETSVALGASAVQVWVGNSKGYASKLLDEKTHKSVCEYVVKNNLKLIAHSPYILNFARPLQETPDGIKALERYLRDLINITNLGGIGSVLHMGSNVKELKQSMGFANEMFVKNLTWIIDRMPDSATIILENMAGGGTRMCCKMDEMIEFWQNNVPNKLKPRIKWCIDTAHLYAAGEYDLSNESEAQRFYKDFDEGIGWEHVLCIHLNGSKTTFGSNRDNHADIGPIQSGYIKTSGLLEIVKIARETSKFLILEVPTDEYSLSEQFALLDY